MDSLRIIILAAGKGERMGGTKPKVMFELHGKPLIDYVIATARKLIPERIIVVVGFGKKQVIEHLKTYSGRITDSPPASPDEHIPLQYVVQEEQLGTGHAVRQAEPLFRDFNGTIVILNGDVPLISLQTVQNLIEHHRTTGVATTVLSAEYTNPFGYGRIIRNAAEKLERIVEEKDAAPHERAIAEVNTGTYVFRSDSLFPYVAMIQRNNTQREYYLTDIIEILHLHGLTVSAWKTPVPEETYGINTPEQLQELNKLAHTLCISLKL